AVAFRQTSGDFAHITLRLRQSEHAECENKTQQDRFSHSFLLECYMDNWILDAVCPSRNHRKRIYQEYCSKPCLTESHSREERSLPFCARGAVAMANLVLSLETPARMMVETDTS